MSLPITQVSPRHWHAHGADRVVGRGEAARRPDGRLFLSIDVWHDFVFDQLARTMLSALPRPLHTVVDEADTELIERWQRAGFTVRRREWELIIPTIPGAASPGILRLGEVAEEPLRAVEQAVKAERRDDLPAEIWAPAQRDLSRYAATVDYAGFVRVVPLRQPRIGLIAVRPERRRQGIGTALLIDVLGTLHDRGFMTAAADVHEDNVAALAFFDRFGAGKTSSNVELVVR